MVNPDADETNSIVSDSNSTHLSQTHPAWTRPHDVYSTMSHALFAITADHFVSAQRPPSPDPVRPRPTANAFYEGSRYYFQPPPEPQAPQCTCKVICDANKPNIASWKCYTCAKFDPRSKGWFCNACFKKHHPWYREKHHFVTIAEDDDMEYDLVVQNYRAEQDRTIAGIEGLIELTKENLKTCKVIEEDFRPDDMIKENARKVEKSSQRVWELKHFVRTQLIVGGDEEKVKDLEYDDEKQGLKELIPYKTKGGLTPYARRLHGEEARVKKRRARKEREQMSDEEAAIVMQTGARVVLAKNEMLARVAMNYQKVWNWKYMRYYYVNLRDDRKTSWRKPPAVNKYNEGVVLTPRSYHSMYGTDETTDLSYLTSPIREERDRRKAVEKAIKRQQSLREADEAYRKKQEEEDSSDGEGGTYKEKLKRKKEIRAKKVAAIKNKAEEAEMAAKDPNNESDDKKFQRKTEMELQKFDFDAGNFDDGNQKTWEPQKQVKEGPGRITMMASYKKEVKEDKVFSSLRGGSFAEEAEEGEEGTVDGDGVQVVNDSLPSPSLALIAVGGGLNAVSGLNKVRVEREVERQFAKQKERVMKVKMMQAGRQLAEEKLIGKGGLTREEASKRLQASCRIWLARRELAARADVLVAKVRPDISKADRAAGKKGRSWYFNFRTRESRWTKPKVFGMRDAKEITMTECKMRMKNYWRRGNKFIDRMDMVYPISKKWLANTAATKIQSLGRAFLARSEARLVTWTTWEEEEDEDTGEVFYRHVLDAYRTQWERPWTPTDSLRRLRRERKERIKKGAKR